LQVFGGGKMRLWWKVKRAQSRPILLDVSLSGRIVGCMHDVIGEVDFLSFAVDVGPVHLNLLDV
jgi:hypothetical protein